MNGLISINPHKNRYPIMAYVPCACKGNFIPYNLVLVMFRNDHDP